jgi:GT2 family glycosyltransferase
MTDSGSEPVSIYAVVVLYKTRPSESVTLRALGAQMDALAEHARRVRILLYDNTPGGCDPGPLSDGVVYEAAPKNGGIAAAYNRALDLAQMERSEWLLTLDQDTHLPPNFLSRMIELVREVDADDVGAIVPHLSHGDRLLSPLRIRPWGASYLPRGFTGIGSGETSALNSASMFRVRALRQIGGFDPDFWLDCQDTYVFRQLHRHGKKVQVAGDLQVKHDLSLLSTSGDISAARFRNFLHAESAFCDLYGGWMRRLALTARLAVRLRRQQMQGARPEIRNLTRDALKRRLFHSRARRIREWREEMRLFLRSTPVGF